MKCVIASNNQGKLHEFSDLLKDFNIEFIPQGELGIPNAIEDGLTFVENALIKARHAALHSGLPAIADDSGLCVPALAGAPGLLSARYAGEHGNDAANNAKLLDAMQDLPDNKRAAYFYAVIVLMRTPTDPSPLIAEGFWHGQILHAPRGQNGFGYNPVFFDEGSGQSAAEMSMQEKNKISHRANALRLLRQQLSRL